MTIDLSPEGLRGWTFGTLIPAWIERAVDRRAGGYVELLESDGRPIPEADRGTLTTARLVYTFSHAAHLGGGDQALAAARHGFALLSKAETLIGYVPKRFLPDGTATDARLDLYDLAFVLFACAHYHRATGETAALALADRTMAAIEAGLAHRAGGFAEDDLGTLPRRQNPHMHLLEAFHALAEASGSQRWLDEAGKIASLAATCFIDAGGTLGEFFDEDWAPMPGLPGRRREPGHQFEWVWLLHHHHRLTGWAPAPELAEGLFRFGLAHGLERAPGRSPLALDAVAPDGAVLEPTKLLWPQTELIKALAARWEFLGDAAARDLLRRQLGLLFRHYVDPATGLWANQLDADERPLPVKLPARVLYHLFLCLAEVMRVGVLETES
jgi:mannose/cellobiose epimerase-like protein (N-acyl-D-glucosamine 2-epimerase family)